MRLFSGRSSICHSSAKLCKPSNWQCFSRTEIEQTSNSIKLELFMNTLLATALESGNILNCLFYFAWNIILSCANHPHTSLQRIFCTILPIGLMVGFVYVASEDFGCLTHLAKGRITRFSQESRSPEKYEVVRQVESQAGNKNYQIG